MIELWNILLALALILTWPIAIAVALIGHYGLKARLGLVPKRDEGCIWIHAASVGEVGVAATIRDILRKIDPEVKVFMTAVTKMGVRRLKRISGPGDRFCLLPLDFLPFISIAFHRARPSALIVVETELWPNLLLTARRRGIPVILANGRISGSTMSWARQFPRTFDRIVGCIDRFLMKSKGDADNLIEIGADSSIVEVLGNLKFAGIPEAVPRIEPFSRRTIVFGSARQNEYAIIAGACEKIRAGFKQNSLFIVAPRHLHTANAAKAEFEKRGLSVISRSSARSPGDADVYLLDTMGELLSFYAVSDIAFVGGTLADYGGHNPLEPAFFGKPIIFGPYRSANKEAFDVLVEADAGITVTDADDLSRTILELLSNDARREAIGRSASEVVDRMKGISQEYARAFEESIFK